MFCKFCGHHLEDGQTVCDYCHADQLAPKKTSDDRNILAIIGFVLSLFTALIGMIVSIIALVEAKSKYNGDGRAWAIAGIAIGATECELGIISIILVTVFIWAPLWNEVMSSVSMALI